MAKHGECKGSAFRWLAAALVALTAFLAAPEAFAQDPFSDFFGGLFGGGGGGGGSQRRARQSEQPRMRRIIPHQESRTPTYWRRDDAERSSASRRARRNVETSSGGGDAPARSATTTESEKPEIAANYFVATMGDTFALLLANGLEETFADKPEIGVLKKAKESSGLVRDDFYDWPQAARDIANGTPKVDVAVVMLGSNDRQPLRDGDKNEEPFSPRWRELYTARVDAILAAFHEKKIPVIWVGLPVMKNESFSADMAKLNEIYREEVSKAGGAFVDTWEALADEKGQFTAFGPDINGQIVKLRTADGVHITDAGALSVAHFVANEIKKLYESAHPGGMEPPAPTAAAPAPATPAETPAQAATPAAPAGPPIVFRSPVKVPTSDAPALPDRPAIGPVQALSPAPTSATGASAELARPAPKAAPASVDSGAMARHVFIEGGEPPPRENRADDSSWKTQAH